MKNKLIITGLLLAGLFIVAGLTKSSQAQGGPQSHWCVIIGEMDVWHYEGPEQHFVQDGLAVNWIDASPSAPKVNKGASIAATIAYLLNEGASHHVMGTREHLFTK